MRRRFLNRCRAGKWLAGVLTVAVLALVVFSEAQADQQPLYPEAHLSDTENVLPAGGIGARQTARNVELVGQVGGLTSAVAVEGNLAYVGVGQQLLVVDVSDPTTPTVIGRILIPAPVWDIALANGLAYVANGYGGLRVVDISDPAAPQEVGFYSSSWSALGVAVSGHYAYIAADTGLRIVDISDPAYPVEVGFRSTWESAMDVAVQGDYAYVAAYGPGLVVIRVTDPAQPEVVGGCGTGSLNYGIAVAGTYAYIANSAGLAIMDVSNPEAPNLVGQTDPEVGPGQKVEVAGNLAYVASLMNGLQIVDLSEPAHPSRAGAYDTPGYAYGLAVAGHYALVADGEMGLRILDVSVPNNVQEAGALPLPGYASGLDVRGEYAYVASGQSGLYVVSLTRPELPAEIGAWDSPDEAFGVTVSGTLAFVADGWSGLRVVDVSNPSALYEIGYWSQPYHQAKRVVVDGPYAYVVHGFSRPVYVVDISDPTRPVSVTGDVMGCPVGASDIELAGDYAYLVGGWAYLEVYDVSNPRAPVQRAYYVVVDGQAEGLGIAVAGRYAYVAACEAGVHIVDVSDPDRPRTVGVYDTPGCATDVIVEGEYAYVADGWEGLRVLFLADPISPVEIGFYKSTNAVGVQTAGDLILVADERGGLLVLRSPGLSHRAYLPLILRASR